MKEIDESKYTLKFEIYYKNKGIKVYSVNK